MTIRDPDCPSCNLMGHGCLIMLDGARSCPRHRTAEERALLDDISVRAGHMKFRRVTDGQDRWGWPYGPNIHVQMRLDLLNWAETRQLVKAHPRHSCLHWVELGRCMKRHCLGLSHDSRPWVDHLSTWLAPDDGRLLLAQPYNSGGRYDFTADRSEHPGLTFTQGLQSWYGLGTVGVTVTNGGASRV